MNNDLPEEWRDKLAAASFWQGYETLLISKSVDDILAYAFRKVLPVLAPSAIDTVRISFVDLQKQWKSEYLVETEAEPVEDMIRTNLEIDSQRDCFSTFGVTVSGPKPRKIPNCTGWCALMTISLKLSAKPSLCKSTLASVPPSGVIAFGELSTSGGMRL